MSNLTKELIYGLSASVLSTRYDNPRRTPECHLEWWELCCSPAPFVAIAAPRGHAKSTAITHTYTLANILFKERDYIIIVSDTYDQAVLFLNDIKNELLDNEALVDLFGQITFEKDSENDVIGRMEDGHRFRITAKGSEQKVRGLKWSGKRPNLIVCDDLENDEIVLNKERREKFKKWFTGALLPCRSANGIVRVVGTILHMDSLLENLMPKYSDKRNTVIDDLKTSSKRKNGWISVKYKAHNSNFTKILWPERWPRVELEKERQRYIDIGNPEGYSQEYLNEPIDESRAYFRRADLLPMVKEDFNAFEDGRMRTYMAADFAVSDKERADFTAIVVGALDQYNVLHIVDMVRGRMDAKEIIDTLLDLQQRYEPEIFTAETGTIQKSLGPFLKAEMMERGIFMNINLFTPTKDKESRARGIQARMRQGAVRFNKESEWYPELEQELLTFPRAVHDDQVDALAWLGITLDKMAQAPTDEELEEEIYEDMEKDTEQLYGGRNSYTGY